MIPGGRSVVNELIGLSVVVYIVFFARIISKWMRVNSKFEKMKDGRAISRAVAGFKRLQADDCLMSFNMICFTVVIVAIWLQVLWGNNYVTPEDFRLYTPEDIQRSIAGSKWGVAMELCKVTCVWGCKACLLMLYFSMTKGLANYRKAVIAVAVYAAVGYVVVMTCLFFVWCRPFHLYWALPVPDDKEQCMTWRHHMITDACLNITGDAAMVCLPIPLLLKAKLPIFRKLALLGVFSLGIFVIICAILNRITNFNAPVGSLDYLKWYAGEMATAVIVANIPHLWLLISRIFKLGSFQRTSQNRNTQFTLQSAKASRSHTSTLSEERIVGNDFYREDTKFSDHSQELILEVDKGRTTTNIGAGRDITEDDKHSPSVTESEATRLDDSDLEQGNGAYIVKTVAVKQYSHAA